VIGGGLTWCAQSLEFSLMDERVVSVHLQVRERVLTIICTYLLSTVLSNQPSQSL